MFQKEEHLADAAYFHGFHAEVVESTCTLNCIWTTYWMDRKHQGLKQKQIKSFPFRGSLVVQKA